MRKLLVFFSRYKLFLTLVLLSIIVKAVLILDAPGVNRDAAIYIAAAQKFSSGLFSEGAQLYPMPLYPLLLAGLHLLVPDWILAGYLLSAIPLLLCMFPMYLLTLRLFGRGSAVAATTLFAALPVFNEAVVEVIRDPLFLLFALGSLACVAQYYYRPFYTTLAGAVILAVLATLVRVEGVLLLVLIPTLLLWNKRENFSMRLLVQSLCAFIVAAVLLGLVVRVFSAFGIASQSRLPEVFAWIKGLITLDILSGYKELMAELKQIQQQLPAAGLRNNIVETTRHYAPVVYGLGLVEILVKEVFPTSLLALWGLRCCPRPEDLPSPMMSKAVILWPWCVFVALNLLFSVIYNFTTTRYMWLPIALALPLVGLGIASWWYQLRDKRIALWILMGVFFVTPALKTVGDVCGGDSVNSIRAAGLWLQQHDPQKQLRVIFNDRRVMLYADRLDANLHLEFIDHYKVADNSILNADMVVLFLRQAQHLEYHEGFYESARFESGDNSVVVWEKSQ